MNPAAADTAAGPSHALPGARTALGLLLTINLFNYLDRYILAAVLPEVQKEYEGLSDFRAGVLASAFLWAYMVASPVFGWAADRWNRWVLVGVGVLGWSAATAGSGLATGFAMMLVCRIFVGIGEAAYGPAAPTIISDMYPVARRGTVMAWFYAAIPVGSALGFALGGAVLAAGLSWHKAFFFAAVPGVILGVWSLMMKDPPRGGSEEAPAPKPGIAPPGAAPTVAASSADDKSADHNPPAAAPPSGIAAYKIFLRIPSYVYNTIALTAMTFAIGGVSAWMPKFIVWSQGHHGQLDTTDPEAVKKALAAANGLFGPIVVVAGLVSTLAGGWVGDKLRDRIPGAYFVVSGIAMLLGFPAFLAVTFVPFPAAWGFLAVAVFLLFFNTGPGNTALANSTPPQLRSAAFALNILIIHALGDALSPAVIGLCTDLSGGDMRVGYWVVSAFIVVSGVVWLWGARYLDADTAAAPTLLPGGPLHESAPLAYPVSAKG